MTSAKLVLQSATATWKAVQRVAEAAREVLPEAECEAIDEKARSGATRSLTQLEETMSTPPAPPRREDEAEACFEEDEPTEVRDLRQVLTAQAAGG